MSLIPDYSPPPETKLRRFTARFPRLARFLEWAFASIGIWVLIAGITLVFIILIRMPFYALLVAVLLVICCLQMLRTARIRRAGRVLWHVQSATHLAVPLSPYLRSAANSENRFLRRRLKSVADVLESGAPIAAALASAAPELDNRTISLILLGETTHRLPEMFARIQMQRAASAQSARTNSMLRWYVPIMICAVFLCAGLMVVFVIPKFERILRDFKVSMPAPTRIFLEFMRAIANGYGWVFLLLALIACVAWIGWDVMQILHPRGPSFFTRRRDLFVDRIPLLSRVRQDHALADVCWAISAGCRDNTPLSTILRELLTLPLHSAISVRLQRCYAAIEAGQSPADAAAAADLPPLLASILRTAGVRLPDALDVLGDYYDARSHRLLTLLRSAATPIATLFFAFIVLGIALAIFSPMQAMVEHLMALTWRVR